MWSLEALVWAERGLLGLLALGLVEVSVHQRPYLVVVLSVQLGELFLPLLRLGLYFRSEVPSPASWVGFSVDH